MNANQRRLPARFDPETRFEVNPAPPATFRAAQETELERLKARLLRETLGKLTVPGANSFARQAANEAAALAWETRFPTLVFPTLFEEKVRTAVRHAARQHNIRERSLELLAI